MFDTPIYDAKAIREMQEILPGLFLSGSRPSESRECLNEKGITHILQITDINTPRFPGEFIYKIIAVPDMDETNLIKHFPDTHKFIDGSLGKGGKVLVHCMAGASRSVTIVCAYLMRTKNVSAAEALAVVQALRPIAGPNDGFMTQLNLYSDIEFDVNTNRTEYRRFLIASMAAQREMFGYIDDMTLAADPLAARSQPSAATSSSSSSAAVVAAASTLPQHPLKCKKCRRALAARDNVISHTPGQGQNAFEYRKRDATLHLSQAIQSDISTIQPQSSIICQSHFIEPVEWIQGLHGLNGKIACPKCDSKLGTFNWSGEQCSCGTWVTPAFMLHKGKVDG
ncbi:protein-tyrosine phosphatase-like protein [Gamsiella multidivaricata]|uniref:protein-tyrosine phosphatase-like protein n=1 Tax=Gamsiella multidivaricata TaxID=101098 RepID=UPI00221FBE42|nr:protein-tyrosine phosphatase-like protein [Gamsiella multidivaricata]KAG0364875.1 dual specificity phosphatase 12 [Gamsiella multidivaricata]KAI7816121.1 protein-tyrosine phosphatase-like protein [Gamsiella multidivaricata]